MAANQSIQNWIEAPLWNEEQTAREQAIIREYTESIDGGVYSVPSLIRDMGPYLTSDTDLISAARVLSILAPVFSQISSDPQRQDAHALVEYFCARLENRDEIHNYRAGIREVAAALLAVAKWKRFLPGDAQTILYAVFGLATGSIFNDQKPATRLALFELVDYLFHKYSVALRRDVDIGILVEGIVSLAELEKNPSCLGVIFPLYSYISSDWELKQAQFKIIWDSYIRYFPITIGGTTKDPSVPTREALNTILLNCFFSSNHYAKQAFPRWIEMLDTSSDLSANTKKEVFDTLLTCVTRYSSVTLSEWYPKLWDSLKFEIWNGDNEDFINGSLNILRCIATTLSESWDGTGDKSPLTFYVETAVRECINRLQDSKAQYLLPSGRILNALASGSPEAFHLVAKVALPVLRVVFQDVTTAAEKDMVFTVLNDIIRARVDRPESGHLINGSPEYLEKTTSNMDETLALFRDALVETYSSVFPSLTDEKNVEAQDSKDMAFVVPAIRGLTLLFRIPTYLTEVEQGPLVVRLTDIVLGVNLNEKIRQEIVSALQQISVICPTVFENLILKKFIELLPSKLDDEKHLDTAMELAYVRLDCLIKTCCPVLPAELDENLFAKLSTCHENFQLTAKALLVKYENITRSSSQLGYGKLFLAAIYMGFEAFETALNNITANTTQIMYTESAGPITSISWCLVKHIVSFTSEGGASEIPHVVVLPDFNNPSKNPEVTDGHDDDLDMHVQLVGKIAMLELRSKIIDPQWSYLRQWNEIGLSTSGIAEPSLIWALFKQDIPKSGPSSQLEISQRNLELGSTSHCLANVLSTYILAGVKPEDKDQLRISVGDTAAAMIRNALSVKNKASKLGRYSMLGMLQLLVNKFGATKETLTSDPKYNGGKVLDVMLNKLAEGLPSMTRKEVDYAFQTLAYFTAASVACFDPTMGPLVAQMVSGVSDPVHGRSMAKSFRILLAPSEILSKKTFCTIRPLRKARLFAMTVPQLVGLWQTSGNKTTKDNCLIAIAGVIAFMEGQQLSDPDTARMIFPIILEGSNVENDDWVKESFICTLAILVDLCPKLVNEYVDSIMNRMIERTHNTLDSPSDGNVRCRVLALEVLTALVKHTKPTLLQSRSKRLMIELDVAKDDCSREVRKKAEQCKMAWLYVEEDTT